MFANFDRRSFLFGSLLLTHTANAATAIARRTSAGGRLSFRIPWPLSRIDPHVGGDMGAAIFSSALFDSLYRPAVSGFLPSLAEKEPTPTAHRLRVQLREGLLTASGKPIQARDVVASVERARARGAAGWLANVAKPRVVDEHTVEFATSDDQKLMAILASPLLAIVPRDFRPESPDGTGPFRVSFSRGEAVFRRNANAAEGPAFLEEMRVRGSVEISESLRAFEAGKDDLGWLGTGLHETRKGAKWVDAGTLGWVLLATGVEAGTWDSPGAAQALADSISYPSVAHLKLGAAWPDEGSERWQGPPCDMLVADDCPWLIDVAKTIAALIASPGHEVNVRPLSAHEFAARRKSRQFSLALDVARAPAHTSFAAYAALAAASDPGAAATLSKRPPLGERSARAHGRHFRVGVVGEVRAEFGRASHVHVEADKPAGVGWGALTLETARRQAQRTH